MGRFGYYSTGIIMPIKRAYRCGNGNFGYPPFLAFLR